MFLITTPPTMSEIHSFNNFLTSLPSTPIRFDDAGQVIDATIKNIVLALKVKKSYDNLSNYVINSDKYNAILAQQQEYLKAQQFLQSVSHTKEEVLYEPNYLRSCGPTLTVVKHTFIGTIPERVYDNYDNYTMEDTDCEIVFYTQHGNVIEDITTLAHPYIFTYKETVVDTVADSLHTINYLQCLLNCNQFSRTHLIDICIVFELFDWSSIYNYTSLPKPQIERLVSNYLLAKNKKYIIDDKIVAYNEGPWRTYEEFLQYKAIIAE